MRLNNKDASTIQDYWLEIIWYCIDTGMSSGYGFLYGNIENNPTKADFIKQRQSFKEEYQYPYIQLKEDIIFLRKWFGGLTDIDREILFDIMLRTATQTARRIINYLEGQCPFVPLDQNWDGPVGKYELSITILKSRFDQTFLEKKQVSPHPDLEDLTGRFFGAQDRDGWTHLRERLRKKYGEVCSAQQVLFEWPPSEKDLPKE